MQHKNARIARIVKNTDTWYNEINGKKEFVKVILMRF